MPVRQLLDTGFFDPYYKKSRWRDIKQIDLNYRRILIEHQEWFELGTSVANAVEQTNGGFIVESEHSFTHETLSANFSDNNTLLECSTTQPLSNAL